MQFVLFLVCFSTLVMFSWREGSRGDLRAIFVHLGERSRVSVDVSRRFYYCFQCSYARYCHLPLLFGRAWSWMCRMFAFVSARTDSGMLLEAAPGGKRLCFDRFCFGFGGEE